jgi:L-methionine (R)-S-oxide reductase
MTIESSKPGRDYASLAASVRTLSDAGDRAAMMAALVDAMWDAFGSASVSWLGFYLRGVGDELVLGASRDTPACSPIGLQGVCGRSFLEKRTMIAADVHALGDAHVVCDPRNLSEIVVPMIDVDGSCWGVLDLDSYEIGAFDEPDAEGLASLLIEAGLSAHPPASPPLHL